MTTEVYVRKASGMVRELSWTHLLVINSFTTILMIWPVFIVATSASAHPEADVLVPSVIAFFAAIPFVLMYWMFSASMPRAGGDYVFLSRTLSAPLGFTLNFTLITVLIYYVAIWIVSALNPALTSTLYVLGVKLGNQGLVELANSLTSQAWIVGLGMASIVIFAVLSIVLTPRGFGRFALVVFAIATLAVVPSFLIVATTSQADFVNAINAFALNAGGPEDYYNYVVQKADLTAVVGAYPVVTASAIIGVFGNSYWPMQWSGFLSSYVSGEVKNVKRSQLIGMFGCLVVSLFVAVVSISLLYRLGSQFIHSMGWLYYDLPAEYHLYPGYPGLNFISQVLTDNVLLISVIGVGYFLSFILYTLIAFVTVSRSFFAWSFDRVIPTALADVHPRFRTPHKAIIVLAVVTGIFVVIVAAAPVFFPYFWMVIPNSVPWLALSVAAIVFPFRKRELFKGSPVNYRIGPIPVISLVGALAIIPQLVLTLVFMFDPNWSWGGATSPTALMLTVGMMGLGAVIYFGFRSYRKHKGIDIGLAFKEIPPE